MNHSPMADWADQKPGRWILIWCALVGLFILGSSLSPREEQAEREVIVRPIPAAQIKADQLAIVQQQTVGPEGICTETQSRVIQCRDKHNRKAITLKEQQ